MRLDDLVMSCASGAQSIKSGALQFFDMDHAIFSNFLVPFGGTNS